MQKYFLANLGDDKSTVGKENTEEEVKNPNPWMNKNIHFHNDAEDMEVINCPDQFSYSEFKMTRSNRSTGSNKSNLDHE